MKASFPRRFSALTDIVTMTEAFFAGEGLDASLRPATDLCLEELFVNMVTYNTETKEPITIELQRHGQGIRAALTDRDVDRFDPRKVAPVDVELPLEQREPGGLGLYLVFKVADAVHYEYRERTSRITFTIEGKHD